MSAAEIKQTKKNLKAWIDDLSDTNILSMLEWVRTLNESKSFRNDLTPYEQENINAGLEDIKNGQVISSEEFWAQLKNG